MKVSNSSMFTEIDYNKSGELILTFVNGSVYTYVDIPALMYADFIMSNSLGSFYNKYIKSQFKTKQMAETRKKINRASTNPRTFMASICVSRKDGDPKKQLNKNLLEVDQHGNVYLNMRIRLQPDGEVDQYGNCIMLAQATPKSIREKEKELPNDKKTSGPILGNGCEFEPEDQSGFKTPGEQGGEVISQEVADDLPF